MVAGLVGAAAIAACSSDEALQKRVDELDQQLRDLRRSHALTSQRVREVDRLGQTTFLIQDSLEQLSLEVDAVRSEQAKLADRVKIMEAAVFTEQPAAPSARPRSAPVGQAAAAGSAAPAGGEAAGSSAAAAGGSAGGDAAATPEPQSFDDPRSLYQHAYGALEEDRTRVAVAAFEDLLDRFAESDLADNAHYWLGEIYVELADTGKAQQHFHAILNDYPAGNKVPDAMYKLGILAQEAGDCGTAIKHYQQVIQQYPWSPVSEKAGTKMDECTDAKARRSQ